MEQGADSLGRYAILAGVDGRNGHIKACAQDVCNMKALLARIPFAIDLHELTELPFNKDSTFKSLTQSRPTPENLKSALDVTALAAKEGDFVYIYFSGHGRRVVVDGYRGEDVELALLGKESDDPAMLYGEDLATSVREMVNKRITVLLVLDCCFSGATVRGGNNTGNLLRDVSQMPDWIVDPKGFTVMAACGPDQSAEIIGTKHQEGRRYSAFTYMLCESLSDPDPTNLARALQAKTLQQIYDNLFIRFEFIKELAGQRPMLYGNSKIRFLSPEPAEASPETIAAYWPLAAGANTIWLQAGEVHGICEGDMFSLKTFYEKDGAGELRARAAAVGSLSSSLEVLVDVDADARLRHTRWMATPTTRYALKRYPVRLSEGLPDRTRWRDAVKKHPSLDIKIADTTTVDKIFAFHVVSNNRGGLDILDKAENIVSHLPVISAEDADGCLAVLDHLARFKHLEELASHRPLETSRGDSFRNEFHVWLETDSTMFAPGNETIEIGDLKRASIGIKNQSAVALYAQIFDLGPRWQAQPIWNEIAAIPAHHDEYSGVKKSVMQMSVPEGLGGDCYDTLVVFIATRPTNLSPWKLPYIGQKILPPRWEDVNNRMEEQQGDWAVLNFRIHISKSG